MTSGEIEAVRGVQSGEVLKHLMDKGLLRLAGRDESLGRPYLYGTTKQFLKSFGLRNLHELPLLEWFRPPESPDPSVQSPAEESVAEESTATKSLEATQATDEPQAGLADDADEPQVVGEESRDE